MASSIMAYEKMEAIIDLVNADSDSGDSDCQILLHVDNENDEIISPCASPCKQTHQNLNSDGKRPRTMMEPDPLEDISMTTYKRQGLSLIDASDFLPQKEIAKKLAAVQIDNKATVLRKVLHSGSTYKVGESVELNNGCFLRIVGMRKDHQGSILLSGHTLKRVSGCGGMGKEANELVWVIRLTKEEDQVECTSKPQDIQITEVKQKRNIIFSNQAHSRFSYKACAADKITGLGAQEEGLGRLFCRWKFVEVVSGQRGDTENSVTKVALGETDPVPNARIDPMIARALWRRVDTTAGGSCLAPTPSVINVDCEPSAESTSIHASRQYTFGDAFCGAGGASCGARFAGLHLEWAFDMNEKAIKSYADNFAKYQTRCLWESVDGFLRKTNVEKSVVVDVLHISFPCQPYSAANTTPNHERNETNRAVLFSVHQLLEAVRPRIATIEQTEGIVSRHIQWFYSLLNIFVSLDYSVRWKVVNCRDYGVPQDRKRLIMIAAGPGEKLPSMPKPTHGPEGSGLAPHRGIKDAIADIPRTATHHDTNARRFAIPKPRLDSNNKARTVTCGGGQNYHPSGLRPFTIREYACLQTIPVHHSFGNSTKTDAVRQIGNAFPPLLARAIFRSVKASLEESDRGRN